MLINSLFDRVEEYAAARDDAHRRVEKLAIGASLAFAGAADDMAFGDFVELAKAHAATPGDFYASPPSRASEFQFVSGTLSFQSPIHTETQANNIASATVHGFGKSRSAVVVLPHWNARAGGYGRLCAILAKLGFTAVELTPPYHGARSRPGSVIADYFVSPNLGRTIRSARQMVLDTRKILDWLEIHGCKEFALVGFSMGSCISALVAAHDARVRSSSLLLTAGDYAEVVWTSRATWHIRESLEESLSLDELRSAWSIISSGTFAKALARDGHRILVLSAEHDHVAMPHLTERLCRQLEAHGADYRWRRLACGHYSIGAFPFNIMVLTTLLRFLRFDSEADRFRLAEFVPRRLLDAVHPES